MTYKITHTELINDVLVTTVEYDINGNIITCNVAHMQPKDEAQITQNIINRALSEEAKLNAIATNATLIVNIPLNETNQI